MSDSKSRQSMTEWERLNALVDGELDAAEHADIAVRLSDDRELARSYATLARLKSSLRELAQAPAPFAFPPEPGPPIAPPGWPSRTALAAAASVAIAALCVLGLLHYRVASPHDGPSQLADALAIHGRAFPAQRIEDVALAPADRSVALPDLSAIGLVQIFQSEQTAGSGKTVRGAYLGPRGCRVSLHVIAGISGVPVAGPVASGTNLAQWTHERATYLLIATSMSAERFSALSRFVEAATRPSLPETDDLRISLQRTWQTTTPCTG